MAADRSRTTRNVLFGLALLAVTAVLVVNRLGPPADDGAADEPKPADEWVAPSGTPEDLEAPSGGEALPPPALLGLSFQAYAERYEAVRDSFRARDGLVEEVVGKRVVWEGTLRNVSKQTNAFYVSISPQEGYGLVSALVTFPHAYEDTLYAFRPDDRVRFEGVVTRASSSIGIEGTAIERIAAAAPAE